jgi:Domain of unknown function (DUF6471)
MAGPMVADAEWQERVKRLLKAELKKAGVSYKMLAERLAGMGVKEGATEQNIANKLSRGSFSAVFLVQCLEAIGCDSLRLK